MDPPKPSKGGSYMLLLYSLLSQDHQSSQQNLLPHHVAHPEENARKFHYPHDQ